VVAPKANIRLRPNFESQVIQQVQLGDMLQSVGETGEWYRVNLPPDEDGIVISGYIHQSFIEEIVEKVTEVPEIEEKKPIITPALLPETRVPKKSETEPKIGVGIISGYAMLSEEKYESGLNYGANFCFGVTKNIAIELSVLRFQSNVEEDPKALSNGKLSVVPIQLGIQARFPINGKFVPYIVGGGRYYLNSFSLDTETSNEWNSLGFDLEEKVENAMGFYFGVGIDFFFTKNLALNADVRYGIAKIKGSWTITDQIGGTSTTGDLENLNLGGIMFGGGLKFCF